MAEGGRGGWLLACAALAAIFLVGEGVARWKWQRTSEAPRIAPSERWGDLPRIGGVFQLGRPHLRAVANGVLWETNAHGLRGPDRTLPKPPGVFRIALIGDSIAAGMGVVQADTYAARLERGLGDSLAGGVEVVNLALAGLNAGRVIDRYERLGPRYEPDLIVYGYTFNDIEGPEYRRSASRDPLAWLSSPVYLARFLGPRIDELRELWLRPRGSYVFELDDNYFDNPEAWAAVGRALDRLGADAEERSLCGVVFVHPRLHALGAMHPFHRHYEQVAQAARERGLHPVDAWSQVRGHRARELHVSLLDPHPNAEGHGLLFDGLREGLVSLPAHCWGNPPAAEFTPPG